MITPKLRVLANTQWGYFTARQAGAAGYSKDLQRYHARCGNWHKISRALFRLPGYADCIESEFVRWTLWAEGRSENRQIVISHASALHYYGLCPRKPEVVELTLFPMTPREAEDGCRLHLERLEEEECSPRDGFRLTTPLRTLQDMSPDLYFSGSRLATISDALNRGLITREQATRLNGGKTIGIGLAMPAPINLRPQPQAAQGQEGAGMHTASTTRWSGADRGGWQAASRSFTLIEMLVVIAIISILASLLMPALSKARESSYNTFCINNVRGIGLGVTVYTGEYNNILPPDGVNNKNGEAVRSRNNAWCSLVYQYATGSPQPAGWNGNTTGATNLSYWNFPSGFKGNLFFCPSLNGVGTLGSSLDVFFSQKLPYGMNQPVFAPDATTFIRITAVPAPGNTVWLTDSRQWFDIEFSMVVNPGWLGTSRLPSLRHGSQFIDTDDPNVTWSDANLGHTNAWFLDGHCAGLTYGQITGNQTNLFRIIKR